MSSPEREPPSPPLQPQDFRRLADDGIERARQFLYDIRTGGLPRRSSLRKQAFRKREIINWVFPGLEQDVVYHLKQETERLNRAQIEAIERAIAIEEQVQAVKRRHAPQDEQ